MPKMVCDGGSMGNPLVMWSSCGLYTALPYGYNYERVGTVRTLQDRMGVLDRAGGTLECSLVIGSTSWA